VPDSQPGYLVFISHSSKDRWIAAQMAAVIERKAKRYGVRTFLDESIWRAATASPRPSRLISARARSS
jgi:hypothetical protein